MLDDLKNTVRSERQPQLDNLAKADWEKLAGSELPKRDQLGDIVQSSVRYLIQRVLRYIADSDKNIDSLPPHLYVYLRDDIVRRAVEVLSLVDTYNRERLQATPGQPFDKTASSRRILQQCSKLEEMLALIKDHRESLRDVTETAELKTRLASVADGHSTQQEQLKALSLQIQEFAKFQAEQGAFSDGLKQEFAAHEAEHTRRIEQLRTRHDELLADLSAKLTAADELRAQLTGLQDESKKLLETTRSTAARVTADEHASAFDVAFQAHDKLATRWLCAIVVVSVLILGAVLASVRLGFSPPLPLESWTTAANLSYFSARGLIMSVLSFLLVVAVRNYRSAKHNSVANAHRSNALRTFPRLQHIATARAQEVVLLQMTSAIFSPQSSGYDGSGGPATHFGELARTFQHGEAPDDAKSQA